MFRKYLERSCASSNEKTKKNFIQKIWNAKFGVSKKPSLACRLEATATCIYAEIFTY